MLSLELYVCVQFKPTALDAGVEYKRVVAWFTAS